MALRWATFFVLVFVIRAGSTFAQTEDSVTLGNVNGGEQNGVVVWGDPPAIPLKFTGPPHLQVGALNTDLMRQVVAFTVGRPPALKTGVAWGSGVDDVSLTFPSVYQIPIKFWILCANAHCGDEMTGNQRGHLAAFLLWANKRLKAERTGLELRLTDDHELITDLTAEAATPALPLEFETGTEAEEPQQQAVERDDCPTLDALPTTRKVAGAFNVYMVDKVNKTSSLGDSCGTDDMVVIGRDAIWGTILHELGHNLSLKHTDNEDWVFTVGGKRNLMHGESTRRRYLTEGQVFRIHFSTHSGLNGDLSRNRPDTPPQNPDQTQDQGPPRDCDNNPGTNLACPLETTIVWADW